MSESSNQFNETGEREWLAEQFEANRSHLRSVAYRMLGSQAEADDAVQEAWLRLQRSAPGTGGIDNLGGWLTRVVGRVCLDMLRSRKSRREEPLEVTGADTPDPVLNQEATEQGIDPEHEAVMADSVGLALLVVLDTLGPAERLAFVLHDLFGVPFEEIAPIVGRSPAAARQLASRARRRVQGKGQEQESEQGQAMPSSPADLDSSSLAARRRIVQAFLSASRGGDFEALVALLGPGVVLRSDDAAVSAGATSGVRGAREVAATFSGRARFAQPALLNGEIGAVWAPGGQPRVMFAFTIENDRIVEIAILADPDRISQTDLAILED